MNRLRRIAGLLLTNAIFWILLILGGMILLAAVIAVVTFRYCDRQARERGYIDRTTNY